MIVIGMALLLHSAIWRAHGSEARYLRQLTTCVLLAGFVAALCVQAELALTRWDASYGSDEASYWSRIVAETAGEPIRSSGPAPGLIFYGAWILRWAFLPGILWVRLANVVLYSLSMNLLLAVIFSRLSTGFRPTWSSLTRLFILGSCNGIVLWTIIRVGKEPLLIFAFACIVYCINLFQTARARLLRLLGIVAAAAMLASLRAGAQYLVLLATIGGGVSHFRRLQLCRGGSRRSARLRCAFLIVASIALAFAMKGLIAERLDYAQMYEKQFGNYFGNEQIAEQKSMGRAGVVIGIGRFLTGPGPYRAARQCITQDVFMVSCTAADCLILFGAAQWWATLFWAGLRLASSPRFSFRLAADWADLLLIIFAHVATYTYLYAGSADTRHRGLLYALAVPIVSALYAGRQRRARKVPTTRTVCGFLPVQPELGGVAR
jgi:hypothetical protein